MLSDWKLTIPEAGSNTPLHVAFNEPLDHALASRLLQVLDRQGQAVPGRIELGRDQQSWSLTSEHPWRSEMHTLRADEKLEDLAGNTPARVFDTDLDNPDSGPIVLRHTFQPK